MESSCRDLFNDIAEHRPISWKIAEIHTSTIFFKIDQCWASSMESSCRDLFSDMAEQLNIGVSWKMFKIRTIIDRKTPPHCNHLDIGMLRLPTLLGISQSPAWFRAKVGNRNAPMSRWLHGMGRFFCPHYFFKVAILTFWFNLSSSNRAERHRSEARGIQPNLTHHNQNPLPFTKIS